MINCKQIYFICIQVTYLQSNTHILRYNFKLKSNVVCYKGGDRIATIFLFNAILELLKLLNCSEKTCKMTSRQHQPQTSTSTPSVGESADGEIADDLLRIMKRRRMLVNTDVTGIDLGPKKQMVRIKSKQQN